MEMGRRSANGGGKVVTFADDAVNGIHRNISLSSSLDIGNKDHAVDAGRRAARPLPTHGMGSRRRTYTDVELDVFSAERYFKGAMDCDGGGHKVPFTGAKAPPVETTAAARPAEAAVVIAAKPPSSTRASTVSSAASSVSSANSQTVLFRGGRHGSRDKRCCVQVGVLMRTCSGKRSVRVDSCASATKESHGTGEPSPATASRIDWYRELRMHKAALGLPGDHGVVAAAGLPPSLSLGTAKVAAIGRDEKKADELTFSSSSVRRSFALVAPVRATVPASNRVGVDVGAGKCGDDDGDDDDGSESSSDLFEIKSLMIEDCPYEPSEASIQWSVVTADASSERGDHVSARWASGGGGRQYRDHRPVGLLAGCASHRAVDVSPAAMQRRGDGFQKARRNGA